MNSLPFLLLSTLFLLSSLCPALDDAPPIRKEKNTSSFQQCGLIVFRDNRAKVLTPGETESLTSILRNNSPKLVVGWNPRKDEETRTRLSLEQIADRYFTGQHVEYRPFTEIKQIHETFRDEPDCSIYLPGWNGGVLEERFQVSGDTIRILDSNSAWWSWPEVSAQNIVVMKLIENLGDADRQRFRELLADGRTPQPGSRQGARVFDRQSPTFFSRIPEKPPHAESAGHAQEASAPVPVVWNERPGAVVINIGLAKIISPDAMRLFLKTLGAPGGAHRSRRRLQTSLGVLLSADRHRHDDRAIFLYA